MTRYTLVLFALLLAGAPPAAAQWLYLPTESGGMAMAISNEDDTEKLVVMCVDGTWTVTSGSNSRIKVAAGKLAESLGLAEARGPRPDN